MTEYTVRVKATFELTIRARDESEIEDKIREEELTEIDPDRLDWDIVDQKEL